MLDLETLGKTPGCAILSIGAVEFDPATEKLGDEFYTVVNRASCLSKGMHECPETLDWWARQSPEARKVLAEAEASRQGIGGALVSFAGYLQKYGKRDLCIWGNGADFDVPIIKAAYDVVKMPLPFLWYNSRCYRTIRAITKTPSRPFDGTAHNALDDAKDQARNAIIMLRKLGSY